MKNRLSIKVFECPKLLKENFMRHVPGPLAEFLHASLIKLSYEDYLDKKRGRKQVRHYPILIVMVFQVLVLKKLRKDFNSSAYFLLF